MNKAKPHSRTAQFFHWGFLVLFLVALVKQIDEVEELEDFALLQYEIVFATIFLLVLLVRFIYMRVTRPTALPDTIEPKIRYLARAVHIGMYLSLSLIAVTGLAIGVLFWQGQKTGTVLEFTLITHELFVIATYWLIGAHVLGALYHRRLGDGIWDSMVPFLPERSKSETGGKQNEQVASCAD